MDEQINILRTAVCIDNNDNNSTDERPKQTGRCKLRILPEMNGMAEDKLPWCAPFLNEGSGTSNLGTHKVLEVGEYCRVLIRDKYWQHIEWLNGDYVEGFYPYSVWTDNASKMTELGSMTYPQPNFMKALPDGSIMFYNSETGESGIHNSNGSYCLFDKDGSIFAFSKKDIKLYNDSGSIELTSNGQCNINDGNLTVDA
jgi:hypothetical protein